VRARGAALLQEKAEFNFSIHRCVGHIVHVREGDALLRVRLSCFVGTGKRPLVNFALQFRGV